LYLVIQGEEINTDDHDNEKQAHPEHDSCYRKEGCPEKSNERDEIKHDPGPKFGELHVDLILIDHLIKYL
jgi:hypothetical protein